MSIVLETCWFHSLLHSSYFILFWHCRYVMVMKTVLVEKMKTLNHSAQTGFVLKVSNVKQVIHALQSLSLISAQVLTGSSHHSGFTQYKSSGEKPKCKDGSDQTFCLHDVFTGCFTTGTHGIRVADCNSCFCELRDKSSNARKAMVYNDSIVGKQIMGTVCMDR